VHRASGAVHRRTGGRLSAARQEAAYRIAQEALHNALRHANPTTVRISLAEREGTALLEITDDGDGFDADAAPNTSASRRLGLLSMRERALAWAGGCPLTRGPAAAPRCDWCADRWLSRSGCSWWTTTPLSGKESARSRPAGDLTVVGEPRTARPAS